MYAREMVKFLKKVRNIIYSWYLYLFTDTPKWAINRMWICSRCQHKENVAGVEYCGKCFCIIKFKALVEDEVCLDGRWPNVND